MSPPTTAERLASVEGAVEQVELKIKNWIMLAVLANGVPMLLAGALLYFQTQELTSSTKSIIERLDRYQQINTVQSLRIGQIERHLSEGTPVPFRPPNPKDFDM